MPAARSDRARDRSDRARNRSDRARDRSDRSRDVAKDQKRSLLRLKDRNSVLTVDNQALRLVGNSQRGVRGTLSSGFTFLLNKVENPESPCSRFGHHRSRLHTGTAQSHSPARAPSARACTLCPGFPNPGALRIRDYHPRTKVPEMPYSFHT